MIENKSILMMLFLKMKFVDYVILIFILYNQLGEYNRDDVVGHEIVGKVIAVGDKVTEFKIGQRVGIGAASSACRECNRCKSDNEQYCAKAASTYNAPDVRSNNYVTQGGYSSHSIADEQFVSPDDLQVLMLPH